MKTGNDIVEAVKGLSETALANIELNRNDYLINEEITNEIKNSDIKKHKTKTKIKTIKGISNLYFWKWPVGGEYDGYIQVCPLAHVRK